MDATASRRLRNLSTIDVPSVKETYPYLTDARRGRIGCVASHTSPYNVLICLPFHRNVSYFGSFSLKHYKTVGCDHTIEQRLKVRRVTEYLEIFINLAVAALNIMSTNVKKAASFKLVFVKEDAISLAQQATSTDPINGPEVPMLAPISVWETVEPFLGLSSSDKTVGPLTPPPVPQHP
ncbi:hypothetical protein HPB47_005810 [Ixodes persulcatus]|uniref:Uncharacterized protein n=1 Tax=Ixodes persulcatus TaxID=34615 RepID=A0AC60PCK2_IXOPE|nr:hypothetical protein HPB47_005810 [Ixodes persulcatus]